jgi:hypothetical protein
MTSTTQLGDAARIYGNRVITVCTLGLDDHNIAKRPLSENYPRFHAADNTRHDWSAAKGLGIVLGKPSGNLAVIDVDDVGLSEHLLRNLQAETAPPLMVRTARGRLHIYCLEPTVSRPIDLEVRYQGRRCLVQLLAAACVAAAPPTPGYSWIDAKAEPYYGTAGAVWNRIAKSQALNYREARPYSFLRRERSLGPTTDQLREAARW